MSAAPGPGDKGEHHVAHPPPSLISRFTRHPNAANLFMVLMILFGIYGIARINTQFFPSIEIPVINITTEWVGASAEDVESNVLEILEPSVRFIDGVQKMTSYAREGAGTISLEFDGGADMQKAVSDVDAAVKAVTNLPEESETPKVTRIAMFDPVAKLSVAGDVPESTLRIYAKRIRDDLIARGIDKIEFTGVRDREMQVRVPESELRRLDLSVSEVARRIEGNSRDLPSGQIRGGVDQQVRVDSSFETPRELAQIEVRSFATGEKVRLGDVAAIEDGYADGQVQGFAHGKRAIELAIQRSPTADTLEMAAILDGYLTEIEGNIPPGITIHRYDEASDALVERLMLLVRNGVGGLVIVVLTLFLFLNARIALWVAAGIPIATLATIGILMAMGQSINMISLFALIMMLGIIVDDAIVVGEHTATRFAMGDSALDAAEEGAGRMMMPVIAAMATTAAAFAPILLIRDTIGQVMGVMPMVVLAVLIASLLECFFVLPAHLHHALQPKRGGWSHIRHLVFSFIAGAALLAFSARTGADGEGLAGQIAAAREAWPLPLFIGLVAAGSFLAGALVEGLLALLRRRKGGGPATARVDLEAEEGWFRRNFDRGFEWFRAGPFSRLVALSYAWRYVTLSAAMASLIVVFFGLYMFGGRVQFVFFPSPESENISVQIVMNAGLPEEAARGILDAVETSLDKTVQDLTGGREELVRATFVKLGKAGRNVGDNLAEMSVQLTTSEFRSVRTPEISRTWRENLPKLPGINRISIVESRGGPPGRDIDLRLSGGDVATLKAAATEIVPLVAAVPGTSGVADDLPYGKPELVMTLTPRGAALGFTMAEIASQVRNAFDGAVARRFADGDDEVTIRVTRTTQDAGGAALRNFELISPAGDFVPLSEVVHIGERQGFSAIVRMNGRTSVSITADLNSRLMTTEKAVELLTAGEMPRIAAKYGLSWEFAGRAEEQRKAFADLGLGVLLALTVIYIILAWVFSDYWRPVAIMLIIPFGVVGAVLGHWLLGLSLNMTSMASLLGLAGILVNDSIVLVSRMDERLEEGDSLEEAAVGASRDRLRAVLLTSLTTIGGLAPLLFEKSIQAQFVIPMAVTISFGLGVATLWVLFLVPALVGIGDDIRRSLAAIFARPVRQAAGRPS